MISGRLITGWLVLLLATLLTTGPVLASPSYYYPRLLIAQRGHTDNGGISLDEAVAKARRHNEGKVLSAETIRVDGRTVHRIKILTKDGRVKRTRIDARTGNKL